MQVAEITFRSPAAADVLARLAAERPDDRRRRHGARYGIARSVPALGRQVRPLARLPAIVDAGQGCRAALRAGGDDAHRRDAGGQGPG
ncbi:hypothetical protein, partial [Mesorhizobium sp.]|uniref:hypothetical protein n=1 Tax=Mesorhizobium sp. TaxID=1871066 RepID=UPI00339007D1